MNIIHASTDEELDQTHPGILHTYAIDDPRLAAFEHTPKSSTSSNNRLPANFVLFLGGLNDDLLTVRFPKHLARTLNESPVRFSVVEVRLTSSSFGWTTSNLDRDADEVAKAVSYFRHLSQLRAKLPEDANTAGNVILLGHSTGSQIATTYLIGNRNTPASKTPSRPTPSGVILQACASDREGVRAFMDASKREKSIASARKIAAEPAGPVTADAPLGPDDHMPRFYTTGLFDGEGVQPQPQPSAKRWLSLTAEGGDDDLFSSDLSDEAVRRIWGSDGGLGTQRTLLCVLWGEKDEFIPESIDKEAVLQRWRKEVSSADEGEGLWDVENSGVVPRAGHNLNNDRKEVVDDLCGRIMRFCQRVARR